MDINERLYVDIVPMEGPHAPHPHPITDGGFDPAWVYKVLGMYNPSETSECYFVLSNPQRQIWFIPQRHLRAFGLLNSDALLLPVETARRMLEHDRQPDEKAPAGNGYRASAAHNGNGHSNGNGKRADGNGVALHGSASGAGTDGAENWPARLKDFG